MAGKRANGEGSIYRRMDGRWAASVSLDRGRRKHFYGRTRQEVAQRLTAALKNRQDGVLVAPEKESVASYLQRWLHDAARPTVRATTFEGYERIIRLHVVPELGRVRLARLTPPALSRLYRTLLDKGLSPKTVRLVHALLHRAFSQAVRWRLVGVNVADAVDAPRPVRREFRTLSSDEALRLMGEARSDRLHALFVLAIASGMREAELLGLRWSDVNLEHGTLSVRQQAMRVKGQWLFTEPKTSKGRRVIALPPFAIEALRQHRVRHAEERLRMGTAWEDHDLVFPNHVGRPVEKQNLLRRHFWPLLERAGLPHMRFHDLRHTAATLLLSEGVDPKVVQERLGHSTINTTMDVYSHVMPTLQREAAGHLERLFATS
jgi:integrase